VLLFLALFSARFTFKKWIVDAFKKSFSFQGIMQPLRTFVRSIFILKNSSHEAIDFQKAVGEGTPQGV
jgi:hypothetical protein